MAHFYSESDIDLSRIRSLKIAILGYGSQGRPHALNLRDSGLDVIVGLYEGSMSWPRAQAEGFNVVSVAEATQQADVLVFCLPDVKMAAIYAEHIAPHLRGGQTLLFIHGFAVHFGLIRAPSEVDIVLVAPKGAGYGVRQNYEEGFGVPGLIAVGQDCSGSGLQTALGYAWGIGCARVMLMETSFREETVTDLFGEQAVLCGGIPELIKAGFDTLVAAGYQPEAAYFECLHETKLIVDLLYARGLAGMRRAISDTAEYGGLTAGPAVVDQGVRERMKGVLDAIEAGAFTERWTRDDRMGRPELTSLEEAEAALPVEAVGAELRRAMRLE
jgi:ketol-acid reductoisomerase